MTGNEDVCRVEGCGGNLKVKGLQLCSKHYEKQRSRPHIPLDEDGRYGPRNTNYVTPTEKQCGICKEVKPAEEFYKRDQYLLAYCKPCHLTYSTEVNRKRRAEKRAANPKPVPVKERTCTFEGCEDKQRSSGLCSGHYYQWHNGQELRPKAPRSLSMVDENHRRCTACLIVQTNDAFYNNAKGKPTSRCKGCAKKISRFSRLMLDGDPTRALGVAETMPEAIRNRYVGISLNKIEEGLESL